MASKTTMPPTDAPIGCIVGVQQEDAISLSHLNSVGIEHAKSSRYGDAIQCFQFALDQIREMKPVNELLVKLKEQSSLSQLSSLCGTTTTSTCATATDQPALPRFVYDEGMDHLASSSTTTNPLPICVDDSNELSKGDSVVALVYNLGDAFLMQGQDDGAIECFRTAFGLTGCAVCPKNQNCCKLLLLRLHVIGRMQYRRGEIENAIRTFSEAFLFCQHFGSGNMALLDATTLNCLGVLHMQLPHPDLTTSKQYLTWALSAISLLEHSSDDRLYATILNNMGRVHCVQKNYKEAEACFEEAMELRQVTPGVDQLDLAATLCNLGQTCQLLGRLDEAIWYYDEFLRLAVPRLGTANRDVAQALSCIAQAHSQRGHSDQALSCFKQVLSICEAVLGDHPETVHVLNKMGHIYVAGEDYDSALNLYNQVLAIEKAIYEPLHPNIMTTFSNIVQMYQRKGDTTSALKVLSDVLEIQVELLGTSDSNVAATLANIGLIYYQKKDYLNALQPYQRALHIRRQVLGDDSLEVASSLHSIGLVLFKMGSRKFALDSFQECLCIRKHRLGDSHRDVATTWYNIGSIHVDLGNNDEALHCYQHALKVEQTVWGIGHKETLLTLQNIAQIYERRGDIQDAIEYHVDCLNILGRTSPRDHTAIVSELTNLSDLYLQLGKTDKVMQSMTLAARLLRKHRVAGEVNELRLCGFMLYSLAKICPEQACAA